MTSLTLNLPDDLEQFVTREAAARHFEGPAAYVHALLVRVKEDKKRLEDMLLEGLNSGDPIELDEAEWERIRNEVEQQ